jgi:hypothetical protein
MNYALLISASSLSISSGGLTRWSKPQAELRRRIIAVDKRYAWNGSRNPTVVCFTVMDRLVRSRHSCLRPGRNLARSSPAGPRSCRPWPQRREACHRFHPGPVNLITISFSSTSKWVVGRQGGTDVRKSLKYCVVIAMSYTVNCYD